MDLRANTGRRRRNEPETVNRIRNLSWIQNVAGMVRMSESDSAFSGGRDGEGQPASARFKGKVLLITGASQAGIGGAIAERFAGEGASVVLFAQEEPMDLLARLQGLKAEVVCTCGDLRHPDDVITAVETARDHFGKIDVVVNNAGVELLGPFEDLSDLKCETLIDVNLTGLIRMTRTALPYLSQPGGVIVNIASALALAGCAGLVGYSATKGAVVALTRSLALELAPRGIRVVAVAPALVQTPMVSRYAASLTPQVLAQLQASHPLGLGQPADVAAAVAFLASDEARWITGVALPLGWTPTLQLPMDHFLNV